MKLKSPMSMQILDFHYMMSNRCYRPPSFRCEMPNSSPLLQSEGKTRVGTMTSHTGRDPLVEKPKWLRQKAPQGNKFQQVKESLSRLNLHTVCEEAQCPNIGEVSFSVVFFFFYTYLSSLVSYNNGLY